MKVYQFTTTALPGDQLWYAVTEDGRVLASHYSFSRLWGIIDTGPEGPYRSKYPLNAEIMVLPQGGYPPESVLHAAGFVRHAGNTEDERADYDG